MTSPYRIPWLERVDGAAWIAQSLGREAGTVRSLVPPLFPSYLRVTVRAEHRARENPDPLPLRSYMLYRGAVEDAARVVDADAPRGLPDLWWPDDRSWFVATDPDLTFAVLGGPQRLTDGVARLPALHAVVVDPDSDLA